MSDLIFLMAKESLGERLKRLRKAAGMTQGVLAARAGVSQGTIGNVESGIRGYGASLLDIAKALNIEPEYLRMETDELVQPAVALSEGEVPEGYWRLPVLAEAAAGDGRGGDAVEELSAEVLRHVDVLESYIRQVLRANPAKLRILTARGTSMRGQIEDGDIMFVQPEGEFVDDGLYIITVDGFLRVKRLTLSVVDGRVSIESNDGRAPEYISSKEIHRLRVHGRVIGAWTLRRF